jgi:hypothetical protein
MIRIARADQVPHRAFGLAIRLGDRIEGSVALVVGRGGLHPAMERLAASGARDLLGEGNQLGGNGHQRAMGKALAGVKRMWRP